ncbi:MAG: hypothetical protein ACR2IQ_02950 [Minisyncoccia bacterium]
MDTESSNPKNFLSLKEVTDILLITDKRTIKKFKNQFLIPKNLIDPKDLSVDAFKLAKELNLTKLDGTEKFITTRDVEKILGLEKNKINRYFCEQHHIPFTMISSDNFDSKRPKLLFRENLIKEYLKQYHPSIKEGTVWLENVARNNMVVIMQTYFKSMIKKVGIKNKNALRALILYTSGCGMQEIGEKLGGKCRERARQLVSEGKKELLDLLTSTNNVKKQKRQIKAY